MSKWIVSGVLGVLMVLFAALKSVWHFSIYIAISFMIVLSIYWIVLLIIQFIDDYISHFEEDFIEYRAEIINSSTLTAEVFDSKEDFYKRKYKKSIFRYKMIDIAKILFLVAIIIACVTGLILF